MMLNLDLLPVVIEEAGIYRTRAGLDVEIKRVKEAGSFSVVGNVKHAGREERRWHPSGRLTSLGKHPLDIVSRA